MKIGFIGGGMMGEALMRGIIGHHVAEASEIFVSEKAPARVDYLNKNLKVTATDGFKNFISDVDVLFLAVKPQVVYGVMEDVAPCVDKKTVIVSIVAGLRLESLENYFTGSPVVRVMPNTPLAVGEGMACYALGRNADENDGEKAAQILAACGKASKVDETLLDAVTGLSGSGPAYVFLVIDALADGGVAAGLPRNLAIELAAQTLLGSAKMVLTTGKHPDVLRDMVTSPAGTTIAGVRALESRSVRGAFIEAVMAAAERSKELGKTNER